MTKSSRWRENARLCIKMANGPANGQNKEALLSMAREWLLLAAEPQGGASERDEFCAIFASVVNSKLGQ